MTAKNPSLSEGLETPPNKEKHQIAANVGLSSLGYAAVLAAMGVGVGVGVYFDNTIAGSFAAHVLAAIVVALISEYRRKQK